MRRIRDYIYGPGTILTMAFVLGYWITGTSPEGLYIYLTVKYGIAAACDAFS